MKPTLSKGLIKKIDTIPGSEGWWHGDGVATYYTLARDLRAHGYSEEDVIDFLEAAYGAAAGEYGE